jgi:nitrite reductase/ring-hydroxylating ferredoxin subunit
MKTFTAPDGVKVTIANIGGELFCIEDMCSHDFASLNFGWLLPELCQVECPVHEGRFDLRTGAAVQMPAEYPVKAYSVRASGDDILVGPAKV